MKKLKSKLFESLKLSEKEAKNTIGGRYTATGSDTTSSTSANFDVTFSTTNADGSPKATDAVFTGSTDTDQPTPPIATGPQTPGLSNGQ